MRHYSLLLLSLSGLLLHGQVSLTSTGVPYTQDFNTLVSTGTSSTLPTGWAFAESGSNANTLYNSGTGSNNAGDTYSFGSAGSAERAFGGLRSGSLTPILGASFTNNTGSAVNWLRIAYAGEQWRLGATGRTDRLEFQYSTDATAVNNGTWTNVASLNFSAPQSAGTAGLLVGNLDANRAVVTFTITGLNIAPGATFFIRWVDVDVTGADDGLAIDDFSLTPGAGTVFAPPTASGTATSASVGSNSTLSGTLTSGTNPASNSYVVTCNLTAVGGSATLNLPVSGSTFSTTYTVPTGTALLTYSLPCTVADDTQRTSIFNLSLTVTAAVPSLSISDVSAPEGNSGVTSFNFTVSLSSPAPAGGVTFNIATADNTATAASLDYNSQSLTGQTIPQGSQTYNFTVTVNGDTNVEPNETFFVNVTSVVGATVTDGQGQGTIQNDDIPPPVVTSISAIQGSGDTSPLLGQTVAVPGVVTALTSNGYFLQTPDAQVDSNPNTSEGIFVFTNTTPTVAVGQLVTSTGTVVEFKPSADPNSPSITEITQASVSVTSSGNPLPAAVTLPPLTATGGLSQYERFEGMRVQAASVTVVAPTDGNLSEANATATSTGVLYAVFPGVAIPFREAGIEAFDYATFSAQCAAGSGCAVPQFDTNPERLRIDTDGITGQTAVNVNTGNTLSNLIGVMHYGFRAYTVLTTAAPVVGGTPVTVTSASVAPASVLTVGAMNVERLYDTINDPNGDTVVTQTALDGRLNKMSLAIRNHLRTPDVVAFSEVEKLTVLQALGDKINADAIAASQPNPMYQAFLVEGNDIGGIDVGFLVKSTVTPVSVTQLGSALTYTNPCDGTQDLLNDRPTLRLRATMNGMAFTVFVNHLRSLNNIDDLTPCTSSTAGGRVRAKRAAQANYVAGLVQDELTADPNAKIILVGDFNAFEVNDGFVDTINAIMGTPAPNTQVLTATIDPTYANMTNMLSLLSTAQRYSYVFDGNHQTLDHAILNPAAMSQFVGGGYVRLNADFNEANLRGNFNTPERYSDHDPVYVRLSTGTNVTPQFNIARSILGFNRATGLYQMTVTLTNNTVNTINGPLQLAITNLTDKATITNASSSTPGGSIFTNLPASIGPGQSASVLLTFSLPATMPVNFTATVFRN